MRVMAEALVRIIADFLTELRDNYDCITLTDILVELNVCFLAQKKAKMFVHKRCYYFNKGQFEASGGRA